MNRVMVGTEEIAVQICSSLPQTEKNALELGSCYIKLEGEEEQQRRSIQTEKGLGPV